jgi:hypothetical protein
MHHLHEEGTQRHQGDQEVCPEVNGHHGRQDRCEAQQAHLEHWYPQCAKACPCQDSRKRNDEEDAKEELYSLVTVAEVPPPQKV